MHFLPRLALGLLKLSLPDMISPFFPFVIDQDDNKIQVGASCKHNGCNVVSMHIITMFKIFRPIFNKTFEWNL